MTKNSELESLLITIKSSFESLEISLEEAQEDFLLAEMSLKRLEQAVKEIKHEAN